MQEPAFPESVGDDARAQVRLHRRSNASSLCRSQRSPSASAMALEHSSQVFYSPQAHARFNAPPGEHYFLFPPTLLPSPSASFLCQEEAQLQEPTTLTP